MSTVEWYYARDNKQLGPVSAVELKRLAAVGELSAEDLVWREGMAEWAFARNVRGLFDEEGRGGIAHPADQTAQAVVASAKVVEPVARSTNVAPAPPRRHVFDVLLDTYRPHFNAHFVETTAGVFRRCGLYGLLAGAVVSAIYFIVAATRSHPASYLLEGAVLILALLFLHYVAGKSCDALDELNRTTSGRLSSMLLPNCLAVLGKLAAIAFLLGMVGVAVSGSRYELIAVGVAGFLVLAYAAAVAMNPAALGISIAPETIAGEETPAVVLFLLKIALRSAAVALGAGVLCGVVLMGVACVQLLTAGADAKIDRPAFVASMARDSMLRAAAVPFVTYLAFLLGNLIVNIWRSILSLPGKLDSIARKDEAAAKAEPDTAATRQ
jgi:hypothetical protein